MRPVFRFAPSPNGPLHLGHALSALLNFEAARETGGRFLLRIEDIDQSRCRPGFEAMILQDLAWLGLDWEEPVRRQSEHFADYQTALSRLSEMGLVYPAFESRGEIRALVAEREASGVPWPRDPDGAPLYPGSSASLSPAERARRIEAGDPFVLRLDTKAAMAKLGAPLDWLEDGEGRIAADPLAWGDVVLARKDSPTSYHMAVVVDDALQGVSHVVRGRDLYATTAVHRLLQALLGLPAPTYRHHRLILDEGGRKLSKSTGAAGLAALRAAGATPADIRRLVGLPSATLTRS
jgi:glutamyl-Q tRNA(Asp) synthetase